MLGLRAFHDWGRFAGFVLLTVAVWVTDAFSTMTGAAALGIGISFPMALLLLAGLGIGSSLPSTPGYIGVYQFVAVTILTPFGISRDAALAYIFVFQAVGYAVVLGVRTSRTLPVPQIREGVYADRRRSLAGR